MTRTPVLAATAGVLAAAVAAVGSWVPSYWGDEAASVMSAQRSWPSLAGMLGSVDAVHGLYYALLHLWVAVFGTSEFATRLPSAIGVGLMVAGTVVLARRFAGTGSGGTATAVIAGIVCLVLPRTSLIGVEARSYALVAAVAVWLTVLFVWVLDRHRTSTSWWVAYGVAAAAGSYLFVFLFLMVPVHGVYLALVRREALGRWARGAVVAGILSAPIVAIAFSQRGQLQFLTDPRYATVANVLVNQWFDFWTVGLAWALILVLAVSVVVRWRRHPGAPVDDATRGAVLVGLWMLLPTAALLLGNLVVPLYNARYPSLAAPAVALAIAGGITATARLAATRWPRLPVAVTSGVLVAAFVALASVSYLAQRQPHAKDNSDWREVAAYLAVESEPGQAVIFDRTQEPVRDPRLALRLYPDGFTSLDDVGLVTPFDQTTGLWDVTAPVTSLPTLPPVVWAVETKNDATPADITTLQSRGYRIDTTQTFMRTVVYRLVGG